MDYTTPPPMSASTLLGATQLNIVADDIIDIEGRCKAPNVPFEKVNFGDHGTPSLVREAQYNMIHKYITSASENLDLEYSIEVAGGAGAGDGMVSTCMIIGGTTACVFTDQVGGTTYRGVKDMAFLADADGVNRAIQFKAWDSNDGDANDTRIMYLGQIKTESAGYNSFSASRFRDGDTTSACTDLHRLRANIINLNGLAKRGVAGFRARQTAAMDATDGNKGLFNGYLKSTKSGRMYTLVGYSRDVSDEGTVYFKTTFNGSPLTTIAMSGSEYIAFAKMETTACALDTTGVGHNLNEEVNVTVTACSSLPESSGGHDYAYLLYLAEAPGGSIAGYTTPGTFTTGSYVFGNAGTANLQLSTAASDIEHLAGDTSRKGYGSTGSSSGSMPIGDARAVYRFPVHRAGRQHRTGLVNTLDLTDGQGNGEIVQRIYSIHTGDTGYYRAVGGVLNYPATSASPNTYELDDFDSSSRYDSVNMMALPDLPLGMLYYTEVVVPKGNEEDDGSQTNDYIEERYS